MTTVVEAFAAVMGDVLAVRKTGHNQAQNFNFRGVDAVMNAVGPALRTHGVVISPRLLASNYRDIEVGQKRTLMREVTVEVEYTVRGPDGDCFVGSAPGEAMDSGDKGTAKAMSVAYRTFLLQALTIPTDEPDPDEQSHQRAAKPKGSACPKCGEVVEGEGREPLRSHLVELHGFVRQEDGTVVAPPKDEPKIEGGWCATCGHSQGVHVGPNGACGGQSLVGPGNEYDGGDYAPCKCSAFVSRDDLAGRADALGQRAAAKTPEDQKRKAAADA